MRVNAAQPVDPQSQLSETAEEEAERLSEITARIQEFYVTLDVQDVYDAIDFLSVDAPPQLVDAVKGDDAATVGRLILDAIARYATSGRTDGLNLAPAE